jgi:hypothetical protein
MARYEVQDFEDYTHLLALYRNTRAIETKQARKRYMELEAAAKSIEKVRLAQIKSLHARHPTIIQ